jgi:hypothetical protein
VGGALHQGVCSTLRLKEAESTLCTAYTSLPGTAGGAIARMVAPENGSDAHHKVVACLSIVSDCSNAVSFAAALPFFESIFKGEVDLHVISDLSNADATLSGYLV